MMLPTLLLALVGAGILAVLYVAYSRTDAHRNGNTFFYVDRRPNRAGRLIGGFWAGMAGIGLTPSFMVSLETIGSRTGKRRAIPVVLADHGGERYVVSMLGENSPWVWNVRAAGGRAFIKHGRRREVQLVELPAESRAPVLKAFLMRAPGGRPHIPVAPDAPLEAFAAVADSYPVFRIDPAL
jgi:deazaflavin-dependent oxidoreductase (nitroreductase family)